MDNIRKFWAIVVAVSFFAVGCTNATPVATRPAPAAPADAAAAIALLQRPINELFDTARFEVRQGDMGYTDPIAQLDLEGVTTTTVGAVGFKDQRLQGVETFDNGGETDLDHVGWTADLFGKDQVFTVRIRDSDDTGRETVGRWFDAPSYFFPIYFDRGISGSRDWSPFEEDDIAATFEDLGTEEVRGMGTRHIRVTIPREPRQESWDEEQLFDVSVDVWIDALRRPVRSSLLVPFGSAAFVYEVDFWDFDSAVDIELPADLDIRSDGEPYGSSSASVTHSKFGPASFGPAEMPFLYVSDWDYGYTRVEAEFALESGESTYRKLRLEVFLRKDDPLGIYEPAGAWTAEFNDTAVPGTFVVWAESRPIINSDTSTPRPVSRITCPDGAPLEGQLEVFEAEFDEHNGHLDLDRLHFVFEHQCSAGGETLAATGEVRRSATS